MQDEILQRLDALAAQLGVAGEYLWEVLVYQAKLSGVTNLILTPFMVMAAYVGWRLAKFGTEDDDFFMLMPLGGIVCIIGVVMAPILLTTGIKELLNPEYYALQKILMTLGK